MASRQPQRTPPRRRLSPRSIALLNRSRELLDRMTPGNVSHHRGNIQLMLSAVLAEAEGKPIK